MAGRCILTANDGPVQELFSVRCQALGRLSCSGHALVGRAIPLAYLSEHLIERFIDQKQFHQCQQYEMRYNSQGIPWAWAMILLVQQWTHVLLHAPSSHAHGRDILSTRGLVGWEIVSAIGLAWLVFASAINLKADTPTLVTATGWPRKLLGQHPDLHAQGDACKQDSVVEIFSWP